MVPVTGLEPVRYHYRGILSPVRLPIPPLRHINHIEQMAPRVGLEPTAYRLTAGCSTIELPRIISLLLFATTFVIIRLY